MVEMQAFLHQHNMMKLHARSVVSLNTKEDVCTVHGNSLSRALSLSKPWLAARNGAVSGETLLNTIMTSGETDKQGFCGISNAPVGGGNGMGAPY
jgi:hypothetical protein